MSDHRSNNRNQSSQGSARIIELSARRAEKTSRIIRLTAETDGLEMLYSNEAHPRKVFSIKILCWALRQNGDIDAMVPWLDKLTAARQLKDSLNGHWEGYFHADRGRVFYDPPPHKVMDLTCAASYFEAAAGPHDLLQELPDTIGTHAVLTADNFQTLALQQVTCWQLQGSGLIEAMIADEMKVVNTPVLPGDPCLYAARKNGSFKCFFQHSIANKIKSRDPETMAVFDAFNLRRGTDRGQHP